MQAALARYRMNAVRFSSDCNFHGMLLRGRQNETISSAIEASYVQWHILLTNDLAEQIDDGEDQKGHEGGIGEGGRACGQEHAES